MFTERVVRVAECSLKIEITDFLLEQITSGSDNFVVVVEQNEWEWPFLFQLSVQISLEICDFGLERGHRSKTTKIIKKMRIIYLLHQNIRMPFHEIPDIDVISAWFVFYQFYFLMNNISSVLQREFRKHVEDLLDLRCGDSIL